MATIDNFDKLRELNEKAEAGGGKSAPVGSMNRENF